MGGRTLRWSKSAQSSYSKFNEIYTKHYNTAYTLRSEHVRSRYERKNPKPWILPWLEIACARKMIYFINSEFVNEPSPENKARYDKKNEFCAKHIGPICLAQNSFFFQNMICGTYFKLYLYYRYSLK